MLLLTSTSDLVQLVTSASATIDVQASWVDNASGTITPGRTNTAIATATTTTIVGSPGASTQRNAKFLSIRNRHATTACDVTVKHTDGTTAVELFKCTLNASEELQFVEGIGFLAFTSAGATKTQTTVYDSTNVNITGGTITGVTEILKAGTTTSAPLQLISGTNLTAPAAGAIEYDGVVYYSTPYASARGVALSEQFIALASNYTLTSTVATQKLFNVPTNGTLTVNGNTSYFFESLLWITSMSSTSGNALIDLLGAGTAVFGSQLWTIFGFDASSSNAANTISGSVITTTPTIAVLTQATGTGMHVNMSGILRVTTAGTIIPSIGLTTASSAVVNANSYFRIRPIGTNTVQSVGNWS